MPPVLRQQQHTSAPVRAYPGSIVEAPAFKAFARTFGQPVADGRSVMAGVVLKSLSTRASLYPRVRVFFCRYNRTVEMALSELRLLSCSRDARISADSSAPAVYVEGYLESVEYLRAHNFWERRLHVDVLLTSIAPSLAPGQALDPTILVCWCVGVGIGVYFHIVQNILIGRLTDILGVPVSLCFVGFELANRLAPTRALLKYNSHPDTKWCLREDVLSVILATIGFIHDVHICLPCSPLSFTGGGGNANAREFFHEEFTFASCKDGSIPLISTPWADALLHSVLLVGAARRVNPMCSFSFETSAHARQAALDAVLAMFVCVLGDTELHARVEHCKQTSAMLGKRFIITSSALPPPPSQATPPPTVQSLVSDYLRTHASAEEGVSFTVSEDQRSHILRLTSGYYASSTLCNGRGRFAGYTIAVDVWRDGKRIETRAVPLGFELLCRFYGLRPWWLDPLARASWHVICTMVSGAVPASTLAQILLPNFNTQAFVCPPGEARARTVGMTVMKAHVLRILARTKRMEYRLCIPYWVQRLEQFAATGAVITISFTCMPFVRCVRCRAIVDKRVPVRGITDDPISRLALIEFGDKRWLKAGAPEGGLVTDAYPIRLLAIEHVAYI